MDKLDKLIVYVCVFGLIYVGGHLIVAILRGTI
jgi:hypothetical protein